MSPGYNLVAEFIGRPRCSSFPACSCCRQGLEEKCGGYSTYRQQPNGSHDSDFPILFFSTKPRDMHNGIGSGESGDRCRNSFLEMSIASKNQDIILAMSHFPSGRLADCLAACKSKRMERSTAAACHNNPIGISRDGEFGITLLCMQSVVSSRLASQPA